MNAPRSNRNLIITAILGGGVLAYVVGVFLPTQKKIREVTAQIKSEQDYVTQSQLLVPKIAEVERQLAELTSRNASWREKSPGVDQMASIFKSVSQQAAAAGVRTLQFDPLPAKKMQVVAKVPLSMTCEGKFDQVFAFFANLEALPAVVQIDSMQIDSDGENEGLVKCEVNLVVFADNRESSN